jgi:N-acetylneuraminic acid mutarotase
LTKTIFSAIVVSALFLSILAGTFPLYVAGNCYAWKSPMNEARTGVGLAVVNGNIYAVGGINEAGFRGTNEEYYPANDTWILRESMPTARTDFGITACQGKIYCIGGYASGVSTGVNEVYDPARDTWETKAAMPTPRSSLNAEVVDDKIYLIGGGAQDKKSGIISNLNEVYDPNTDTWSTATPIPEAVYSYASAVLNGKIYVITPNLTQIYDAKSDNWTKGAPIISPIVLPSAAATTGVYAPERIYVIGHSIDSKLPTAAWQLTKTTDCIVQSYDPNTDNWTLSTPVLNGPFDASTIVVDDLLYIVGGFTKEFHSDRLTVNQIYTFSTGNVRYPPLGYGTVPPEITVFLTEKVSSDNVSLIFSVNQPTTWIGYSLDGQANVTVTGNITLTGLSNGLHNMTIYAKDSFGNFASENSVFAMNVPESTLAIPLAVIAIASVALVSFGLFVYSKKRKHRPVTNYATKKAS